MPEIISSPFAFRHVAHVGRTGSEGFGLDVDFADLEPDWMLVVQQAGVSRRQLNNAEVLKFIIDFTLKNSDPKEVVGGLASCLMPQIVCTLLTHTFLTSFRSRSRGQIEEAGVFP
jgi:hypothetical protein